MSVYHRLIWRGRSLWVALGAAMTVVLAAGAVSPALASASAVSWHGGAASRGAGHPRTGLSLVPPGLRWAVRKMTGVEAGSRGGGVERAGPGMPIRYSPALGSSVAVSGSTALVGAPDTHEQTGAVHVFVRSGNGTWVKQAWLTGSDTVIGDSFGFSVAVSGSTALVGAEGGKDGRGTAYVFVRSGHTWSQQAELTASDATVGDNFGGSVAISGSTALVGALTANSETGAAYVFVRSGHTWSQRAELIASDAAIGDNLGFSVAVSGRTALVGAPGRDGSTGAAYVFVRSGLTWSQRAELTASDAAPTAGFGFSVAVLGRTALVGAPGRDGSTGAVYVFVRSGHIWSQRVELTASVAAAGNQFGFSAVVSGRTALVGAPGADDRSGGTGAAYVFVRSGLTWSQRAKLHGFRTAAGAEFGFSVAASGTTALVAAPFACHRNGAVHVFVRLGRTWSQQAELPGSAHC